MKAIIKSINLEYVFKAVSLTLIFTMILAVLVNLIQHPESVNNFQL